MFNLLRWISVVTLTLHNGRWRWILNYKKIEGCLALCIFMYCLFSDKPRFSDSLLTCWKTKCVTKLRLHCSCKQQAFLCCFIHLQVIQNLAPSSMAMWHPNRKKHSPVLQNWVLKRDALWGCREIHQDFKSLDKSSCKKQSVCWQTQWLKKPKVINKRKMNNCNNIAWWCENDKCTSTCKWLEKD